MEMNKKWTSFIGAVILASYLLISHGAPPLPVAVGIGMAALWTRRASRSA
jgi:hypothetical protein